MDTYFQQHQTGSTVQYTLNKIILIIQYFVFTLAKGANQKSFIAVFQHTVHPEKKSMCTNFKDFVTV